MPRYRKKVCRECGRVYLRRYVRTNPTLGWCDPNCYMKSYQRRREGKAAGELPDPVDDSAIQDPACDGGPCRSAPGRIDGGGDG